MTVGLQAGHGEPTKEECRKYHTVRHGTQLNRAWTLLRRLPTNREVTVEKGQRGLLVAVKHLERKMSLS